jgi:hypothetical protein
MNLLIFGLWIIVSMSVVLAHDTLISTTIPYSSGVANLNAHSDTVTFSNGIKIFSIIFTNPIEIPENTTWFGGIVYTYPSGTIAYKDDSAIVTHWYHGANFRDLKNLPSLNMANWTYTFENPDTFWLSADFVPRSIRPADSIFINTSEGKISQFPFKFLYSSFISKVDLDKNTRSESAFDYNSILYYLSSSGNSPNMKFQVDSLKIDSSTAPPSAEGGVVKNYVVSNITIRWAVDSLGNGVFQTKTGVDMRRIPNTAKSKMQHRRSMKYVCMHSPGNGSAPKNTGTSFKITGAKAVNGKGCGITIKIVP